MLQRTPGGAYSAPQNLLAGFDEAASRGRKEKENSCEKLGREKGRKERGRKSRRDQRDGAGVKRESHASA